MRISPAYEREYRDWIAKGQFERLLAREREFLSDALSRQHPALAATSLSTLGTCYYTRGSVFLLDNDQAGWYDVQAGYWAALYSLRFEIIAATLPAWSQGRSFSRSTELVTTLAFSRLFQQPEDGAWLEQAIAQHVRKAPHVTDGQTGHLLLAAMLNDKVACTRNESLADRRA